MELGKHTAQENVDKNELSQCHPSPPDLAILILLKTEIYIFTFKSHLKRWAGVYFMLEQKFAFCSDGVTVICSNGRNQNL